MNRWKGGKGAFRWMLMRSDIVDPIRRPTQHAILYPMSTDSIESSRIQ